MSWTSNVVYKIDDDDGHSKRWTRLLRYYLACLRAESGQGVRAQWSDRSVRWVPFLSDREWSTIGTTHVHFSTEDLPATPDPHAQWLYGYPLLVLDSPAGPLRLMPVLLHRVNLEASERSITAKLANTPSYFNGEYLLAVVQDPEHRRTLQRALEDGPKITLRPEALQALITSVCDIDVIEPLSTTLEQWHSEPSAPGLYNRAAFYLPSQTQYTAGLQQELATLLNDHPDMADTALASLLSFPQIPIDPEAPSAQTLPMDCRQRAACDLTWRDRLTVVTGPPGTGKTQVIVNMLADALIRNRRVLFASKNQRAVANVESKFQELAGDHTMIRAGLRAGTDDLRQRFVDLLARRLTTETGRDDVSIYRLRRNHQAAHRRRHVIAEKLKAKATSDLPSADLLSRAIEMAERSVLNTGRQLLRETVARRDRVLPKLMRPIFNRYRASLEQWLSCRDPKTAARLQSNLANQLPDLLAGFPLWSTTHLSICNAVPLEGGIFDLVIIDEGSQSDIASALPLLYRAKRAVVFGDNQQLRHIATLPPATEHQLMTQFGLFNGDEAYGYIQNSLFDAALSAPSANVHRLLRNYRTHAHLIQFANTQWYQNALVPMACYSELAIDPNRPPLQWVDTRSAASRGSSGGVCVPVEQNAVRQVLQELQQSRYRGTVGVVTPFREQTATLQHIIHQFPTDWRTARDIKVATAHGFQGDERDLMIVSLCVTSDLPRGARAFLDQTDNLLNVSLTRARAHTVLVGDRHACATSDMSHYAKLAAFFDTYAGADERPSVDQPLVGPYEITLANALRRAGLDPVPQYPVDQYRVDLALVSDRSRVAIEIDGHQHHTDESGARLHEDLLRDARLRDQGWVVIRFWVNQVRTDLEACVTRVQTAWSRGNCNSARRRR